MNVNDERETGPENIPQRSDSDTAEKEEQGGRTFKDYWMMIVKHWIAVVIITAVVIAGGLGYGFGIKKAKWQASGTVMVYAIEDSTSTLATNMNLSLSLLVSVQDFMNDQPVLKRVTQDLIDDGYDYSLNKRDEVASLYSASARNYTSVEKSLFIDIDATTPDETLSKKIANYVIKESVYLANNDSDYSIFKDVINVTSLADTAKDVSTSNLTIGLASLLIGLIIGLGYAIIRELTNIYIVSKKELENATGYKVIGSIPLYGNAFDGEDKKRMSIRKIKNPHVGLLTDFSSSVSENIQKLQTNIAFANVEKPYKVIAITSTEKREGKSTTLCNMALLYHKKGFKVIVVDLDLRRPSVHRLFKLENKIGIVEYISKVEPDLSNVIQKSKSGVDIITAGSVTPFPATILGSDMLKTLISNLRTEYDYVLLDTTPLFVVTDALLVSRYADGFLLVCAQHMTKKKEFAETIKSLEDNNVNIIGLVMTKVTEGEEGKNLYKNYSNYYYSEGD